VEYRDLLEIMWVKFDPKKDYAVFSPSLGRYCQLYIFFTVFDRSVPN